MLIFSIISIPPHAGRQLKDGDTLADYTEGSNLWVLLRNACQKQFYVKTLFGETITLDLHPLLTVNDVKVRVGEEQVVHRQRVVYIVKYTNNTIELLMTLYQLHIT